MSRQVRPTQQNALSQYLIKTRPKRSSTLPVDIQKMVPRSRYVHDKHVPQARRKPRHRYRHSDMPQSQRKRPKGPPASYPTEHSITSLGLQSPRRLHTPRVAPASSHQPRHVAQLTCLHRLNCPAKSPSITRRPFGAMVVSHPRFFVTPEACI